MALDFETQQRIFDMLDKGRDISDIKNEIGCSRNTIAKYKVEHEKNKKVNGEDENNGNEITKKRPSTLEMVSDKNGVNILDLARNENDLIDMGGQAGLILSGAVADITDAFDTAKPIRVRVSKAFRGVSTVVPALIIGLENTKNRNAAKKMSEEVRVPRITKENLEIQILELVAESGSISIDEISEATGEHNDRVLRVINGLIKEDRLEGA